MSMTGTKNEENNRNSMSSSIPSFTSELQQFDFTEEAIDVALRKLLAKVPLPKESQLIDQAMEDFAKWYYRCNLHLADSYDPIYAVAFSILLLHTDAHNKNVKRKMNKDTFIMRTKLIEGGETVHSEVLDIMYDNIVYSEFSYAHDQQDKSSSWFSKTSDQPNTTLLHDLYPKLEQLMPGVNTFSYKCAPRSTINIANIQQSMENASSVLLTGVRNRQQQQQTNGNETFLARVCKAGIVERKYDLVHGGKRAPARGWRPFGMILSGSQIMYFGDLTSFQTWLDSQPQQQQQATSNNLTESPPSLPTHATPFNQHQSPYIAKSHNTSAPTTMTSFITFNSGQALTSSSTSNLTILPISTASLNSTYSYASNNTSTSASSSTNTMYLRPMQIVSLTNAICVYDKSYRKYPHVFRLITGDGQQFLIQCSSTDDMNDWIQKINYISAMKTTGVRLRPKTTAIVPLGNHKHNRLYQHHLNSQQQLLGVHYYQHYPHHDELVTQHWMKREHKAKATIASLNEQLAERQQQLEKNEQLRNQLMLLAPMQKATKDRLLLYAASVGKRLSHDRVVLERLKCYREIIEWELFCYQPYNKEREKFGTNGHSKRNGKTGNIISRKMSAPLPFYSGLLHGRHSTASLQQQQQQQKHTNTNDLSPPASLEMMTAINNGRDRSGETDGNDNDGVLIPHRSASLLGSLSGDDGVKNKHGEDLTTTDSKNKGDSEKLEISIGSRRQSCPHLNPRPFLAINSPDDDQQQGSTPLKTAVACGIYQDGCHCRYQQHRAMENSTCRLSSRQQQSQTNPFLTTQHAGTTGINELHFSSSQVPNGNKKTHDRSIHDVDTYDDKDDDGDDDDGDVGLVAGIGDDTPVDAV